MRKVVLLGLVVLLGVLGISAVALADRGKGNGQAQSFSTRLDGWQEVPSQVTTGKGSFRATIVSPTRIDFTLRYEGLEGTNVNQAHIHVASFHENGAVSAWLCGTAMGTTQPACPAGPNGTVNGSILTDDITGPAGQGVEPGNFADLLRAMRKGEAYANVHTDPRAPGGEIRGQIRGHERDNDKDD